MDVCIQDNKNDVLVGVDTAYRSRINFYKIKLRSSKETPEELVKLSETANDFSFGTSSYYYNNSEVRMFTISVPLLRTRTGSVISFINNKKITIRNKDYYLFKFKGSSTGWTYMFFLPEKYVLNEAKVYQNTIVVFNVFAFLIGIILCFFVARKKGESYIMLLNGLGLKEEKVKFLHFIKNDEYRELGLQLSEIKNENNFLLKSDAQNMLKNILGGYIEKEKIKVGLLNYKIFV